MSSLNIRPLIWEVFFSVFMFLLVNFGFYVFAFVIRK